MRGESSAVWIYRWYAGLIDHHPMYGRDIMLKRFDKKEDAINYAMSYDLKRKEDIFVEERRYASERNLERDFFFDSHIVWAAWLNSRKEG